MVEDGRNQPVWPCGVYVRPLTSLTIPLFLAGRAILSFWRHRVSRDRASSRAAALSRGRVGGDGWVRLIAGGGVGVIVEVSPAAPLWRVTPIRLEMLSHLTLLDTASLCLSPTLHPCLSLSLSPLPRSLCSCELIGYFIQHRLHNSHLSFVRQYYC